LNNGRSIVVRVNDRGPFHGDRVVDVSQRTAELLDFKRKGMARVKVDYVGPASIEGSDDAKLMASYRDKKSADTVTQLAAFKGEAPALVLTAAADPVVIPQPSALPSPRPRPQRASALAPTSAPVSAPVPAKAPAPAPVVVASAAAAPATTTPAPSTETTPSARIASRIDAGFASLRGSQPLSGSGTMVSPVLSGFAFSPMALSGQR
jgi:rare lipoprotein A